MLLIQVTHPHRLWGWMKEIFVPNVYAGYWHNGEKEIQEVYFENKMSILVGVPRMRQVRITTSKSSFLLHLRHTLIFSLYPIKVLSPNSRLVAII